MPMASSFTKPLSTIACTPGKTHFRALCPGNPVVENQATDRAYRIGQNKNVLVHKFVCQGTVEEKIDAMIESKRQIAQDMLEGGAELLLTEMKDEELLKLVALDLNAALKEA